MPLTRIEVEQIEAAKWVAEVEIGGMTARRITLRAGSFEEIMIGIEDAYRAHNPKVKPVVEFGALNPESPPVLHRDPAAHAARREELLQGRHPVTGRPRKEWTD